MICNKCAGDTFDVVRTHRNKERKGGGWVYSNNDTRKVICKTCGAIYLTKTEIVSSIEYSEKRMKPFERDNQGNLFLYEE